MRKFKHAAFLLAPIISFSACLTVEGQPDRPPYQSAVQKFEFPSTLAEQEEALKSNPVLQRFVQARKRQSEDRYRPIYHFVNPESTMNDPNGLSYWNGNWHLFYQAFPPEDRRVHWGHAISKDLIHWRDLPYAIYPGPERAVYSGGVLIEKDRAIAMYHGPLAGNLVAISSDPLLLNWEKVTGKAVIPLNSSTGFPTPYSVFDPSIWKRNGVYYSLSAGRIPREPFGKEYATAFLFRSKDLEHWEYMHEFVEGDRFTLAGDDIACPYFVPIGDRYILPFFSHMSGGQYLLGDYDTLKNKFVVSSHGRFNFGAYNPSGLHAPSATADGRGGVIIIFNMNTGKPTGDWNQLMTLPRRLALSGTDDLRQEPAGDIESLRDNHQIVKATKLPANKEIVLKKIRGNAMELSLEIDMKKASVLELNVLRSPGKEEYTRIAFYKHRGFGGGRGYGLGRMRPYQAEQKTVRTRPAIRESLIAIHSDYASLAPDFEPRAPEIAPVTLEENETLKLRVFIDKSVVEVFVNGKQALAVRVYPSRDDSNGVSLRAQGNDAELISLDVWQMKSIYETARR